MSIADVRTEPESKRTHMTYAEYAGHVGVPHGTIKRWATEGMPVIRAGALRRVRLAEADAWVAAHHADAIGIARSVRVYFLRADDLVKIGYTSRLAARISELQKATGHTLELLDSIPGGAREEAAMHRRFAALRVRGEWFRAEPELLDFIREVST